HPILSRSTRRAQEIEAKQLLPNSPALFDSVDQSDLDADDVNAMLTAFLRMAMVLKFLQQLHDFGDTAHEILAREVILGRQQQQHGSRQQQQQQQQKEKDKTLANLLRTLDSRAEHYSDPALRAIFLLNNYRYVQNRLERDKMTATVQAYNYEAIKFFEEHQNKNRQSYLNRG
uniref:Exocyst complex component 7 n=1 Tax=Macrostomum lignano TaxID=282301 RepID=A0A1I8IXC1_9PLAT